MKRYLITTADERTWKFDRPVLFLGEWCRLYERRSVWTGMDAVVAEAFGLRPGQRERDLACVHALAKRLLKELADALNAFHKTAHGLRYWNILLGHWLQRYVAALFNRYFTLEQALKNHELSGTTVFDSAAYSLAVADSYSFVRACDDDVWNHVLFARILDFLGGAGSGSESDSASLRGVHGFQWESNAPSADRDSAKRRILAAAARILSRCSRNSDAFILESYLPALQEARLSLALGQCPQLWQSPPLKNASLDPERRASFRVEAESHVGFERFARRNLGDMVPICFMEGYEQLVRQVESLPWPATPKFIFSSTRFDADEIFKTWTAWKVEQGIPYFTGQHGNNYGTLLGSPDWPETVTCDRFFTWGWTHGNPKNVPAFVYKTAARKCTYAASGGLLLIEVHAPHRIEPEDAYYQFGIYQEEQFRFVTSLPKAIRQALTVRLHGAYRSFRWSDEDRWKERQPDARIETGAAPILALIEKSRLVVHSYDSSGILETLALNIPTLCFWHGGLDHLLPGAKPYYQLLRSAGILADTPEHAADLVALRWDNVRQWWDSEEVQSARRSFCNEYARTVQYPVRTLKRLLTAHAREVRYERQQMAQPVSPAPE